MTIKPLPPDVINLIAAGEVIDSFAAVIRELVENALDAKATRIVINLDPDLWRVEVGDNGVGMGLEDLKKCAYPHTTSKISQKQDLHNLNTLGFRGEALHSIVQVADLEIASRRLGENSAGWRIFYQNGALKATETLPIAPGTLVKVSNLFGKWQVRRQGLPSMTQQLKTVYTLIQAIALCHPQVTWQVRQNDKPWFNISPAATSKQILPQILKTVRESELYYLELAVESPPTDDDLVSDASEENHLALVMGLPDRCHRRRPDWVKIAINGRMVRSPELEQTLLRGFSRTLPRERFPVCFLHLQVTPSYVDWNRHPAKAEIYLHSLPFWQEKVSQAIEQGLRMSLNTTTQSLGNQRMSKLLKAAENKTPYQSFSRQKPEIGLIDLKAVGQVLNTYIVAEHPNGLWLVEQHIIHERILYEKLQDDWKIVPLNNPIILEQLTSAQVEQLERLGIEIEPFGEQLWAVRSAPELLVNRDDCQAALIELSLGGDLETAQVATACRSAIRNGTPLELSEMQTLLEGWKNTRNPHTCPHGRPIYLPLEESSLARFFRRHWVIGKSHGI